MRYSLLLIMSLAQRTYIALQNGVLDANVCDRGCKRLRLRWEEMASKSIDCWLVQRKTAKRMPALAKWACMRGDVSLLLGLKIVLDERRIKKRA